MNAIGIPELIALAVIAAAVLPPFWIIHRKAGKPGWLALAQLIPGLNLIMLWWLALTKWR